MMRRGVQNMSDFRETLRSARVMPILTVRHAEDAAPLARALRDGGIQVCEVTLRTPDALKAIAAMRAAAPDMLIGAGTIRTPADIEAARAAGAQFLVTPGVTPELAAALARCGLPCAPGFATASEAMALSALGFDVLKLFPAEQTGGVGFIKAIAGPLPDLAICPTGGVSLANAPTYLAQQTVVCVGGSWVAPDALIAARDFEAITSHARAAMAL